MSNGTIYDTNPRRELILKTAKHAFAHLFGGGGTRTIRRIASWKPIWSFGGFSRLVVEGGLFFFLLISIIELCHSSVGLTNIFPLVREKGSMGDVRMISVGDNAEDLFLITSRLNPMSNPRPYWNPQRFSGGYHESKIIAHKVGIGFKILTISFQTGKCLAGRNIHCWSFPKIYHANPCNLLISGITFRSGDYRNNVVTRIDRGNISSKIGMGCLFSTDKFDTNQEQYW